MGEAVTGSIYQAKFGLVTVNGQFVTAGVAGDFVIISQTGATIIGTSSTEKMRVQSSGNVSINNTNDTYKLDVTGTGRFTGQLRLESTITDGTNTYTLPSATGTLALVGGAGVGTVTSVAALTLGTSGTDLSSTVATSTTTPVITLNVPTASATNRGALSSADWTTFNNKQGTITLTTTGTSGVATLIANTLNIPNYATDLSNYVTLGTNQTISGVKTFSGSVLSTASSAVSFAFAFSGASYAQLFQSTSTCYSLGYGASATTIGTAVINWTSGGNVGINTLTPTTYSLSGSHIENFGGSNFAFIHNNTTTVKSFYAINEAALHAGLFTFSAHPLILGTTNTERMRITSGGNVLIGTTTDSGYKLDVNGTGRLTGALNGTSATFSGRISFSANSGATASGQIGRDATYGLFNWASTGVTDDYAIFSASGAYIMHTPTGTANTVLGGALSGTSATFSSSVTATSYITSSDYRLKNTITPMSSMLDKIALLKPCTYNWNADDTETIGFIAHEVAEIIPLAVIGEKDGEQMQGIDYSKIVAVLVKAIQELKAEIDTLKNK
jgi:hypothetical protein